MRVLKVARLVSGWMPHSMLSVVNTFTAKKHNGLAAWRGFSAKNVGLMLLLRIANPPGDKALAQGPFY